MLYVDDDLALTIQEAYDYSERQREASKQYEIRRRKITDEMRRLQINALETDTHIVMLSERSYASVDSKALQADYPEVFANVADLRKSQIIKIIRR